MFLVKPKQEYKQNKTAFCLSKRAFYKNISAFWKNETAFGFSLFKQIRFYQVVSDLQGLTII